jgi:3-oxoacyl-(acyl-carrier-protein) synthase
MSRWNNSRRERAIREAFKRAGVDKENCYVHVAPDRARVCVYTSLGQVKTDAMRELLYRIDLFTGDRHVLVTEGRRQMPRITIEA